MYAQARLKWIHELKGAVKAKVARASSGLETANNCICINQLRGFRSLWQANTNKIKSSNSSLKLNNFLQTSESFANNFKTNFVNSAVILRGKFLERIYFMSNNDVNCNIDTELME